MSKTIFGQLTSSGQNNFSEEFGFFIITILARRPRGLRAKINLASKEMSVIFGCVPFGLDSGVARVFHVKIDGLQNVFYLNTMFFIGS